MSDGGRGTGKTPNYVTKLAPAFRHKVPGGVKATRLYTELHHAWRAGVISDFYYGKRSPSDPTVVWEVDGVEFGKDALQAVGVALASALRDAGVVRITLGESWCGYPTLLTTFEDGTVLTDAYNGRERVSA